MPGLESAAIFGQLARPQPQPLEVKQAKPAWAWGQGKREGRQGKLLEACPVVPSQAGGIWVQVGLVGPLVL